MPLLAPQFLQELEPAYTALYRYPLRTRATTSLRRQMRLGISDQDLAQMVIRLHEEDRLCNVTEEVQQAEPEIVCSMGLRKPDEPPDGAKESAHERNAGQDAVVAPDRGAAQ